MTEAYQSVFQRYEKKYLLDQKQYRQLEKMLRGKMEPDRYGSYTICNIYYDTDDYRLIRSSLEKPVYKEKLRVRSYGIPGEQDPVFVEIKKKYEGVVYKRRISLPKNEADRCLAMPEEDSFARAVGRNNADYQIACELDWFFRYYHPHPAVYLAYDRKAYFSPDTEGLRLTFDTGIRFRRTRLDLAAGDDGMLLQEKDRVLMEIKIPESMPVWLAGALSDLGIYPVSFSKYGSCYQNYLFESFLDRLTEQNFKEDEERTEQPELTREPGKETESRTVTDYHAGGMDYA